MKRDRFIALLREEAAVAGRPFQVDKNRGKGSHYRVTVGGKRTTVKSGDLAPGYMALVRRQLGL